MENSIKIYTCWECSDLDSDVFNHLEEEYCMEVMESGKYKKVDNPDSIPDWCPKRCR